MVCIVGRGGRKPMPNAHSLRSGQLHDLISLSHSCIFCAAYAALIPSSLSNVDASAILSRKAWDIVSCSDMVSVACRALSVESGDRLLSSGSSSRAENRLDLNGDRVGEFDEDKRLRGRKRGAWVKTPGLAIAMFASSSCTESLFRLHPVT